MQNDKVKYKESIDKTVIKRNFQAYNFSSSILLILNTVLPSTTIISYLRNLRFAYLCKGIIKN